MRTALLLATTIAVVALSSALAADDDRTACPRGVSGEAMAACDRAIIAASGDKDRATVHWLRCRAWANRREWDRARDDCSEAIRLNPKHAAAYGTRCWVWTSKKDLDRAFADCDEAIRVDPKYATAFNNRGVAWRVKGDNDRALADYSEAIRLNPKYTLAYDNRCVAWNAKNERDRAIDDCSEAIRLDPKFASAYINRGNAHRAKGQVEEALADFAEAIRLDPKLYTPRNNRGLLLENQGRLKEALADFQAALTINPQASSTSERVRRIEEKLALQTGSSTAAPAGAEKRVALVLGNSVYANVASLPNAKNDAQRLADALKQLGFVTVSLNLDLPRDQLNATLKTFATQADQADWAMVYYAGHGIELGGANYLIPTDAALKSDRDIAFEAVALDQVLLAVEGARKLRLVILDACRDNPFMKNMRKTMATRSIGQGLARVEPEGATLVAYAAKDGQVAMDGEAENSPFVSALIKHMSTPGLEISLLFRKVRDDVLKATERRQEPFVYGSLPAEAFYFRNP